MTDARDDGPIPKAAAPGELTRDMFDDRVGKAFTLRSGDHVELELILEEVSAAPHGGDRPGGGFPLRSMARRIPISSRATSF